MKARALAALDSKDSPGSRFKVGSKRRSSIHLGTITHDSPAGGDWDEK